ncbi:ectoine/hydroxyectoine ABC transporter permease subunit EhuC [Paracoccus sp. MKU1]|uniref:ectoine/hydroxyectoine ABC transporter permease subunit EhuC n=1 Tax=Paracoccus sp. MKU1 TaxID=1745182 RepID=UPI00071936BB|nr:ectoine/hydroxyectoine ABC transporter permease subunit EhuC [Paracoccus sp. MKU1]KRW96013.1 ectoine/hydroxyectoine ABC transporter permease subunit EhuC [Paracoccus sp. MKU1]
MSILDFIGPFTQAALVTVWITLGASVLALIVAFAAGIGRLSPRGWIYWPTTVYVEFFRGTSCYVQLFWLYFTLPLFGIHLDAMLVGIITIGLNVGSFGSEVVRGAILAVPKGLTEASTALNFSWYRRMRHVILPNAVVPMLPPLSNLMIDLLKQTPLVSLIAIADLTFVAQLFRQQTGSALQAFGGILIVYFLISTVIVALFNALEKKLAKGLDGTRKAAS